MNSRKTFLFVLVGLFILGGCSVTEGTKTIQVEEQSSDIIPLEDASENNRSIGLTQSPQIETAQFKEQAVNNPIIALKDADQNNQETNCDNTLGGCPVAQISKIETNPFMEQTVDIFLIALEDNGQNGEKIGCNDSVLAVSRTIPPTTNLIEDTLSELLSVKGQYYGKSGLYNALYQSDLEVSKINVNNRTASVYLTGEYLLGGMCDTPRFDAQLRQTILQFPEIQQAFIFINGTEIGELFSAQGI
ncbi:MAG: GerMN domain-containing protein [Candidatus Peregrinibacteria bacterium]|nr:GerMN domain-containing protein [Candidatus Peregrinibacteria bacterium]MDZ4244738.1 GerMN domain-containing protein [Candidatus Gracilibacteria bacterium]